jgi:hypothetical protein
LNRSTTKKKYHSTSQGLSAQRFEKTISMALCARKERKEGDEWKSHFVRGLELFLPIQVPNFMDTATSAKHDVVRLCCGFAALKVDKDASQGT